MRSFIPSLAVVIAVSLGPTARIATASEQTGVISSAVATVFSPGAATAQAPARRARIPANDPVTNGAIIGAVAGGLSFAVLASAGCAAGDVLNTNEKRTSCTGPTLIGAGLGMVIGAALGAGIDSLFEQAPSVGGLARGTRKGVRLHWRF